MLVAAACDEQAQPAGSTTTGESPGTSAPMLTTDGPDVSQSPSPDIELAAEGTWVLELLDGRPVIEDSAITLRIGDDWFNGINGCNSYGGQSRDGTPVVGADGVFKIPPGVSVTAMLCPEPEGVMDQADAYLAALVQGERFRITDDRLEILDSGDAAKLAFVKQPPLPGRPVDLEGTAWRLLSEGDTMDGVRAATLVFLDDRLVTGATARRSYVATYRASEGALRFPGKSMLRSSQSWQSLGEKARILEGEFTDFLTWAREYSVDKEGGSSRLRIWSIQGQDADLRAAATDHKGHCRHGMDPDGVRRAQTGRLRDVAPPDHLGGPGNRGDDRVRRAGPGRVIRLQLLRWSGEPRRRVDYGRCPPFAPNGNGMRGHGRSNGAGGAVP